MVQHLKVSYCDEKQAEVKSGIVPCLNHVVTFVVVVFFILTNFNWSKCGLFCFKFKTFSFLPIGLDEFT
jgi:hypothetical protein